MRPERRANPERPNEGAGSDGDRLHPGQMRDPRNGTGWYFLKHCDRGCRGPHQRGHLVDQLAVQVDIVPALRRPTEDRCLP